MNYLDNNEPVKRTIPSIRNDGSLNENRPSGPVKSEKNFRKILNQDEGRDKGKDSAEEIAEPDDKPISLFDLPKKNEGPKRSGQFDHAPEAELTDEAVPENLPELPTLKPELPTLKPELPTLKPELPSLKKDPEIPNQPPLKVQKEVVAPENTDLNSNLSPIVPETLKEEILQKDLKSRLDSLNENDSVKEPELPGSDKIKNKGREPFIETKDQEGDAGSTISALGYSVQPLSVGEKKDAMQSDVNSQSSYMRQIMNKVVDAIKVIQKEGLTETVVTLKYPPILDGAKLTLSVNDAAKNEFHIAFTFLSESGKAFLDRMLAKDSLTNALEEQGIAVMTLKTTTGAEVALNTGEQNRDQKSGQGERENRDQSGRQQNPEEQDDNRKK
jgi:hypothetical protein